MSGSICGMGRQFNVFNIVDAFSVEGWEIVAEFGQFVDLIFLSVWNNKVFVHLYY